MIQFDTITEADAVSLADAADDAAYLEAGVDLAADLDALIASYSIAE